MATITIKGMSCQHCVKSTKEALNKIPGIQNVEVNLDKGEASFNGDIDHELVKEAIEKIGFEVI